MGDEVDEKNAEHSSAVKAGGAAKAGGAVCIFCGGLTIILLLAGITALVLYLVYRPANPHLSIVGAAVYDLNATAFPAAAAAICASMQFTVAIRNPNGRSSVLYDRMSAYVMFRGEPITPPAPLPALYQDEGSTVAVSPLLGGAPVPVSPSVAGGLETEKAYGAMALRLVLMGRIKFKVGPFYSAWRRMFAGCDLLVSLKESAYGEVPILGAGGCSFSS